MRKLIFILIAFIAVVTFIRAFDNSGTINSEMAGSETAEPHKEPL
jgi:hypothetical protein